MHGDPYFCSEIKYSCVLRIIKSGTKKERGIVAWNKQLETSSDDHSTEKESDTYDIPFITKYIRKVACFRFIPVCPSFTGCRKEKETGDTELRVAKTESEADNGVRKRDV